MPLFDTGIVGDYGYDPAMANPTKFVELATVLSTNVQTPVTAAYPEQFYKNPVELGLVTQSQDPYSVLASHLGLATPPDNYTWEYAGPSQAPITVFRLLPNAERFGPQPITSALPVLSGLADPKNWRLQTFLPPQGGAFANPFKTLTFSLTTLVSNVFKVVSGEATLFETFFTDEPVSNKQIAITQGLNVVTAVGAGTAAHSAELAIGNFLSTSASLPSNVAGPVSPGFWSTLGSGNIQGAYQLLANPISAGVGGTAYGFVAKSGVNLMVTQLGQAFINMTGKIGSGLLNLLSGNFGGAIQNFSSSSPQPVGATTLTPFGNFVESNRPDTGGGGGGSGGGFLPLDAKTGLNGFNPVVLVPIVGLLILAGWLLMRRK